MKLLHEHKGRMMYITSIFINISEMGESKE